MAFTDEFHKFAYFGDLYELELWEAARTLHGGLWDSEQATVAEIGKAIRHSIATGELKPVRGSLWEIGKYSSNPLILSAFDLAHWAERHGLELEGNGGWADYLESEAEIGEALLERLEALRALQEARKSRNELLAGVDDPERIEDKIIALLVENSRLKQRLVEASGEAGIDTRENPKSMRSLLRMVLAMAIDGYRYDEREGKSNVPSEIANAVSEKLGESIDADTTRRWLREAAKSFPPTRGKD